MKVVFDTNVYIAAFVSDGVCSRVLRRARRREFDLAVCSGILDEFSQKLAGKFNCSPAEVALALELATEAASRILGEAVSEHEICRDPRDEHVLACARIAGAEYLVTGDKDVLVLKQLETCKIVSPREFELLFD